MNKYEIVLSEMATAISKLESYTNTTWGNDWNVECSDCYSQGIEAALEPMYEIYDALKKCVSEDEIDEMMRKKIEPGYDQLKLPL